MHKEFYSEESTLVIFEDEVGNIDFGIYVPEFHKIICLCCGCLIDPSEATILYNYHGMRYVESTIASGFLDKIPPTDPNYNKIMNQGGNE